MLKTSGNDVLTSTSSCPTITVITHFFRGLNVPFGQKILRKSTFFDLREEKCGFLRKNFAKKIKKLKIFFLRKVKNSENVSNTLGMLAQQGKHLNRTYFKEITLSLTLQNLLDNFKNIPTYMRLFSKKIENISKTKSFFSENFFGSSYTPKTSKNTLSRLFHFWRYKVQ